MVVGIAQDTLSVGIHGYVVVVPQQGVGDPAALHIVDVARSAHLGVVGMIVADGVKRADTVVGVVADLLHDVDFAAGGPGLVAPVDAFGHHPVCGPCAFARGQFYACFHVAVAPCGISAVVAVGVVRVDAARINFTVLALEAVDDEFAVANLEGASRIAVGVGDCLVAGFVGLELVVDIAGAPVHGVPLCGQRRGVVKLVIPDHHIAFGGLVKKRRRRGSLKFVGALEDYVIDFYGRADSGASGVKHQTGLRNIGRRRDVVEHKQQLPVGRKRDICVAHVLVVGV